MKNVWNFFRGKGFYIVLGVGLVAFITLVSVYSYKRNVDSLDKNNGVNLNQSADADEADTSKEKTTEDSIKAENNTEKKEQEAQEVNKTETPSEETAASEEPVTEEPPAEKAEAETTETDTSAEMAQAETEADEETDDSEVVGVVSDGAAPDKTGEIEAGLEYDGEQNLIWPVTGDIVIPYSMETTVYFPTLNAYKCNQGMMIAGEEGTAVLSAYEGVVKDVISDPDKGNEVIIGLGNGYQITYGQITNITVEKGSTVSTGQEIGTIAQPTTHYTKEGSHLYLEMTKDGAPVNPILYFQD